MNDDFFINCVSMLSFFYILYFDYVIENTFKLTMYFTTQLAIY